MIDRRRFVLAAAAGLGGEVARAQESEPTFRSGIKVVNLLATVMNRDGQLARDLTRDDFQVLENGRPQTIRYFARQSDLPLTIGLMVDTSMSQVQVMDAERAASFRFLDRVLRSDQDQVFVMQFDMAVQLAQPLTSSMEKLRTSLRFVDTPTRSQLRDRYGGGTLMFDAMVNASNNVMKGVSGRKALIVLSDGGENGSDATLQESIDAAHRADTLIYSILFGGSTGKSILQRMSRETGGGFFEVTRRLSIDRIYDVIQEELRSQYSLGFVSDVPVRISEFRKVQVIPRQKGMTVQVRDRYWAQR